jgi:mannose-6-phosphate isomerase
VIAEIQQRSDATFRIFDYGRKRELHIDRAVAAAEAGPATGQPAPTKLTEFRNLLVADPHFVLERWNLPPHSAWDFNAERETWIYVTRGNARIGSFDVTTAGAVFAENEHARILVGENGLQALAAYPGGDVRDGLLSKLEVSEFPALPERRSRNSAGARGSATLQ